jgi:RNA polymerase sigma-70 factor (ECF subfamily)
VSAPAFVASPEHAKRCVSRLAFEGDDFDSALIASIAHGDQTAFRELHARYYHRITHFVRAATDRYDLVDEVANDTLWVVWQCAARFRGESKVSTWIMGISRNLSFKAVRAMGRSYNDVSDALEDEGYEPSSQSELTEWLDEALARLPSEQRTVLQMFYGLDQSCEEISQALQCPLNTVKTRMFHGRRKLRELLPRLAGVSQCPVNTIKDKYAALSRRRPAHSRARLTKIYHR